MSDFPERLRLRDTKLFDDLGGAGQRIFTTAGQGYEKQEYVRADVYKAEIERLKALVEEAYTEGWHGRGLPRDGTVGVTEDWERSESRAALNTEDKT